MQGDRKKLIELLEESRWIEFNEEVFPAPARHIADHLISKGVTMPVRCEEWVSVKDRLPEEDEYVMIWCGECQIARIEKGISEEQRRAMERGELEDPCEFGWNLSEGYFELKRSRAYKPCDEYGNNEVPYCWHAMSSQMQWFGQDVTHWRYLPRSPYGERREDETN